MQSYDDAPDKDGLLDALVLENESVGRMIASLDARAIYEACHGFGTSDTKLIELLASRSKPHLQLVAHEYARGADISPTRRGAAAAATWIVRGGDAAAATWIVRGGDAAAATWIFRGDQRALVGTTRSRTSPCSCGSAPRRAAGTSCY